MLLEKPLAETSEEACTLATALERHGVAAWVQLPIVADPALQRLVAELRSAPPLASVVLDWRRDVPAAFGGALLVPATGQEQSPYRQDATPALIDHLLHETAALDVVLRGLGVLDPIRHLELRSQQLDERGWSAQLVASHPGDRSIVVTLRLCCRQADSGRDVTATLPDRVLRWADAPGERAVWSTQQRVTRKLELDGGRGDAALIRALARACLAGTAAVGPDAAVLLAPALRPDVAAAWHRVLAVWHATLCS